MNKEYFKYIISLLIFGTNGIIAGFIPLSSAQIVWSRTILGSLALAVVFLIKRQKPQLKIMIKEWKWMLASGVSMGANWVFLFESYRHMGVSLATLANYCGPVLVIALSPLIFKEKPMAAIYLGVVAVATGMVMVNYSGIENMGGIVGLICGIGAAISYASMIITNKKIKGVSGLEVTLAQLVISMFVVGVYVLLSGGEVAPLKLSEIGAVIFLGVVNTGIACYMYFSSLRSLNANTVAICSYIDPTSAIIFSAIILSEKLDIVQIIGAVLVLCGACFASFYSNRKKQTP